MTGPEHYTTAERLLVEAKDVASESVDLAPLLAEAQVHALLALAAATIEPRNPTGRAVAEAWQQVTTPTPEDTEQ